MKIEEEIKGICNAVFLDQLEKKLLDDSDGFCDDLGAVMYELIHFNKIESLITMTKSPKYREILTSFNPQASKHLKKIPGKPSYSNLLEFALAKNNISAAQYIFTLIPKIISNSDIERLFLSCVKNRAKLSFAYLLKEYPSFNILETKIPKKISEENNLTLLSLIPGISPYFYFQDILQQLSSEKKDEAYDIQNILSQLSERINAALTASELSDVLEACNLLKEYPFPSMVKEKILNCIDNIISQAPNWLSCITKFLLQDHRDIITPEYTSGLPSCKEWQRDFEYGQAVYQDIEIILSLVKKADKNFNLDKEKENFTKQFKDQIDDIKSIPFTLGSFSHVLSHFIKGNLELATKRKNEDFKDFGDTHIKCMLSPFAFGRYSTAHEIVEWVHRQNDEDTKDIERFDERYSLKYEGDTITHAHLGPSIWRPDLIQPTLKTGFNVWHHGVQKIRTNFAKLNQLFEKIIQLDAKELSENPMIFYNPLIEFLWLLGNTTITQRGTGSLVEKFSVYLHKILNIDQSCVLRPGNQRDCLNLSFSLKLIKKLILFLCEPDSLLPGTITYMRRLFETDTVVQDFVKRFNLTNFDAHLSKSEAKSDSSFPKTVDSEAKAISSSQIEIDAIHWRCRTNRHWQQSEGPQKKPAQLTTCSATLSVQNSSSPMSMLFKPIPPTPRQAVKSIRLRELSEKTDYSQR